MSTPTKVFISYRRETEAQVSQVREFAERLSRSGVDVIFDQFLFDSVPGGPSEGWPQWSSHSVKNADRIIIIGTTGWFDCFEGKQPTGIGLGAAWEASLIGQRLFDLGGKNDVIRIACFDKVEPALIPSPLRNFNIFQINRDLDKILKWLRGTVGINSESRLTITWPEPLASFKPNIVNRVVEFGFFKDMLSGLGHERAIIIAGDRGSGKTTLLQSFLRYGAKALGERRCIYINCGDLKIATNLSELLVSKIGPQFGGSAVGEIGETLENESAPLLLLFDDYDLLGEGDQSFIRDRILSQVQRTPALRIVIAGRDPRLPEPSSFGKERSFMHRIYLGPIRDPRPWIEWAVQFPWVDPNLLLAVVGAAEGEPWLIAKCIQQLEIIGRDDALQLDVEHWVSAMRSRVGEVKIAEKAEMPRPEPEQQVRTNFHLQSTLTIAHDADAEFLMGTAEKCKDALAKFLTSDSTQPPLTVSVEAPWGSGKTSLLRHLQRTLESQGIPTVWFNPWKHEAGKTLWAAFAVAFERQMAMKLSNWGRIQRRLSLTWQRLTTSERWLLCARGLAWVIGGTTVVWLLCHGWDLSNSLAKDGKTDGNAGAAPSIVSLLFRGVPWLGGSLVLWAFLRDVVQQFGSPLKLDVARLFTQNKHDDGVDDLHRFHEDFSRLIKAYDPQPRMLQRLLRWRNEWKWAGPWHPIHVWNDLRYMWCRNRGMPRPVTRKSFKAGRIVVFIDDLDRCEAPKAADLLQSLHLMLNVTEDRPSAGQRPSKSPGVICILGMEKEKVAAAVAAKHSALLPLLLKPDEKERVPRRDAMAFGHEFLEKFIQLTLHLPPMRGEDRDEYLRGITGWEGRIMRMEASYKLSSSAALNVTTIPPSLDVDTLTGSDNRGDSERTPRSALASDEHAAAQTRVSHVDKRLNDGHIAFRCASYVAEALDNNPRKLKQFINLFRLRLYLAAAMNVLDEQTLSDSCETVIDRKLSAHHIAKLVALELACPLKMSDARDGPRDSLTEMVRSCSSENLKITLLLQYRSEEGPVYDVLSAPLDLYFHYFAGNE